MARGIQGATNLTKNELSQHILQLSQARGDRKTEVDSSVVAADVEMAVWSCLEFRMSYVCYCKCTKQCCNENWVSTDLVWDPANFGLTRPLFCVHRRTRACGVFIVDVAFHCYNHDCNLWWFKRSRHWIDGDMPFHVSETPLLSRLHERVIKHGVVNSWIVCWRTACLFRRTLDSHLKVDILFASRRTQCKRWRIGAQRLLSSTWRCGLIT